MLELIVRFLALIGLVVLGVATCHPGSEREEPRTPTLERQDAEPPLAQPD